MNATAMHIALDVHSMLDLPTAVDWVIMAIWVAVAVVQGIRVCVLGRTLDRVLQLAGWSILGGWWAIRLAFIGDIHVTAISVIAVLLLALSAVVSAFKQLAIWRADVRCFQDPSQQCYRADRIKAVLFRDQ